VAVALADLLDSLQASLNVPGDSAPMFDFSDDETWIAALANGFWFARIRGFYTSYRVNTDGDQIVNITDASIDLPREDQQIIVIYAAMTAIENKILNLFTMTHDKAGPVETERQRSSSLLKEMLQQRRKELEDIRDQVVLAAGAGIRVQLVDAVLARSAMPVALGAPWVD
jgi:hypothetical protein